MRKNNLYKILTVSGVIGGVTLLNTTQVCATEVMDGILRESSIEVSNSKLLKKGKVVNVDSTFLRIREYASIDSNILSTMNEGVVFDIVSKYGDWYKIQYNNITGYVHGDYVIETSNLEYTGLVEATLNLRVRSSPSLSATVIGYVIDNTKVSIVEIENEWYKIEYNNGYGYVHSDYVEIINYGDDNSDSNEDIIDKLGYTYNLDGYTLIVRQNPTINSNILGSLQEGGSVNIIGEDGNWYKIKFNNYHGYVSKDYIKLNEEYNDNIGNGSSNNEIINKKGQVINVENSNLRVRKTPSSNSLVLGYLLNDSKVDILGKEDNWYKINYKNSLGYVSADYIKVIGDNFETNDESLSISEKYNIILSAMRNQLGAPYVWGGAGQILTSSLLNELKSIFSYEDSQGEYSHAEQYVNQGYRAFDCSGFIQWGFSQANINLGRTTYNQIYEGIEVSLSEVVEGDLIFTHDLGHVGMYLGNGQWIESSFTGDFVRIKSVPWEYVGRARRILN